MSVDKGRAMFGKVKISDEDLPPTDTAVQRGRLQRKAEKGDVLAKEALKRHRADQAADQVRQTSGVPITTGTGEHVVD